MKLNGILSSHYPAFPFGRIDVSQSMIMGYGFALHHRQYGSWLIAVLNYCLQNTGGTTHKARPDA